MDSWLFHLKFQLILFYIAIVFWLTWHWHLLITSRDRVGSIDTDRSATVILVCHSSLLFIRVHKIWGKSRKLWAESHTRELPHNIVKSGYWHIFLYKCFYFGELVICPGLGNSMIWSYTVNHKTQHISQQIDKSRQLCQLLCVLFSNNALRLLSVLPSIITTICVLHESD